MKIACQIQNMCVHLWNDVSKLSDQNTSLTCLKLTFEESIDSSNHISLWILDIRTI